MYGEGRCGRAIQAGIGLCFSVSCSGAMAAQSGIEEIVVTPLSRSSSALDKVPSNVRSLTIADLETGAARDISDALFRNLGSVNVSLAQGNPFQADLSYRGFTASPLLGTAIGLSIYMDGVRMNEGFGDTVNWDLIPERALAAADLMPGSNPVFGLNTLGGAIALRTKTGFTFDGAEAEISGGNFDRREVALEYGGSEGNIGWYLTGSGLNDDGWRDRSPSHLRRGFGTLSWRDAEAEAHLSYGFNENSLTGGGLAPEGLLAVDREAVHTFPDITDNTAHFVSARASREITPTVGWTGNLYYRHFKRDTLNGDAEVSCVDDVDTEFEIHPGLCAGVAGPFGGVGQLGRDVEGEERTSATSSDMFGGTTQFDHQRDLWGRQNNFSVGASYDQSRNHFSQGEAEADIVPFGFSRGVERTGALETAVEVATTQQALGIYFIDRMDLSEKVALTVSGRYNIVRSKIRDRTGLPQNQDLNGTHSFDRFSPAVGLTAAPFEWVTAFGGYSESFRVPTPAELTCADPNDPCNLPNAFVADPPLDPVIGRTWEGGLRGRVPEWLGLQWSLAFYQTTLKDDLLFIATQSGGAGFFRNVNKTRRQGIELSLNGRAGPVAWRFDYGLIDATFRSRETLASAVDPNGINVRPGDRLPGIPRHNLKAGLDWQVIPQWWIGLGGVFTSSQHLRGDEGNDLAPMGSYTILNGTSSFLVRPNIEVWGRVDNLLDRDHETLGARNFNGFASPQTEEQRFFAPGRPRGAWLGVRVRLGEG
jgi:iron complex outermembrane recepter protein